MIAARLGRRGLVVSSLAMAIAFPLLAQTAPSRRDPVRKPAAVLIDRVLANMSAGLDAGQLASIEYSGRETVKDLVENDHPLTAPFYTRSIEEVRRGWDYRRNRQRVDTLKGSDVLASMILAGDVSVSLSGPEAQRKRTIGTASPSWMSRDPVAALQRARQAPDLRLEPDVVDRGAVQHVVSYLDGRYPVRILIGAATLLPTATEALIALDDQRVPEAIAWNALGDIVERTEFMNWSFVDGIRYPLQQDELRNGDLYRSLTITNVKVGVPIETSAANLAPGEAWAASSVQDFRPATRVPGPYPDKPISEIAPGIIQIPNSWFATIIRQRDGLVIIDAPISAGYSKGVLAEADRRFPGVRIKALVTSTGFFWHVAGVREYAARGIPIYAEARNVAVIKRILSAPHRLVPDALAQQRHRHARVVAVTHPTAIGAGENAVTLYPVAMATQPMLMSYIVDAKLLHTGEMVQPLGPGGSFLFPESLIELTDTVQGYRLVVDHIIGMHMSPTPWSAVAAALRQAGVSRPAAPIRNEDFDGFEPTQSISESASSG